MTMKKTEKRKKYDNIHGDDENEEEIKCASARIPRKSCSASLSTGYQQNTTINRGRQIVSSVYAANLINEMRPFLMESVYIADLLVEETTGPAQGKANKI